MVLYFDNDANINTATALAQSLSIELVSDKSSIPAGQVYLHLSSDGLRLTDGTLSMMGDFTRLAKRLKPNNLNSEMLVKAARLKAFEGTPTLLDATAGMGEDSLLLAAAGFKVKLYEYDSVIAALLKDTIGRALKDDVLSQVVCNMEVICKDSILAMHELDYKPDVILLDPMFPGRQKSGLIKKKFQLLQQLESPCTNEEELLTAAINVHPRKIVIKRPLKGPYLANRKPDYSLNGKAIRYDCFTFS